jgi:hypothetical protein
MFVLKSFPPSKTYCSKIDIDMLVQAYLSTGKNRAIFVQIHLSFVAQICREIRITMTMNSRISIKPFFTDGVHDGTFLSLYVLQGVS